MAVPIGEVPKELICSVCLEVPSDICSLKPCSHVFCTHCIYHSLSHQKNCPMCRCACTEEDVLVLTNNSLSFRIWANLAVKCEHHALGCCWKGSMSDYESHERSCPQKEKTRRIRILKNAYDSLKNASDSLNTAHDSLKREIESLKRNVEDLKIDKMSLENDMSTLTEENTSLKGDNTSLKLGMSNLKLMFRRLKRKNQKLNAVQNDNNKYIEDTLTFVQENY